VPEAVLTYSIKDAAFGTAVMIVANSQLGLL
jgi:hypothetical protein